MMLKSVYKTCSRSPLSTSVYGWRAACQFRWNPPISNFQNTSIGDLVTVVLILPYKELPSEACEIWYIWSEWGGRPCKVKLGGIFATLTNYQTSFLDMTRLQTESASCTIVLHSSAMAFSWMISKSMIFYRYNAVFQTTCFGDFSTLSIFWKIHIGSLLVGISLP